MTLVTSFCNNNCITSDYKLKKVKECYKCKSRSYIHDVKPTGFHNLPLTVLIKLFAYFDEIELKKYIIPVCQKWRRVALLPENWKTLRYEGNVPVKCIFQHLRYAPFLQHIYLCNIPNVSAAIRQICRCNKDLVSITVKNCSGVYPDGRLSEHVFRNLIATCKKLQYINLKGTQFYANLFFVELAFLSDLKSINVNGNRFMHQSNLFELVLNCRNLEEFKLAHRNDKLMLTDSEAVFLFTHLRGKLKSLTFDTVDLLDSSYKAIFECKKLEKLKLNNTTYLSSETFINIWRKLPNLKVLKLHNLLLNLADYEALFTDGRSVMSNIVSLDLTGNRKLTDDGLAAITNCCSKLEKLHLKCCKNLKHIECVLENCGMLTTLNLSFCTNLKTEIHSVPVKLKRLNKLYFHRRDILQEMKHKWLHLTLVFSTSEFMKQIEVI